MKSKLVLFSATTTLLLSSMISAPIVSASEFDGQIDEAQTQVEENGQQVDSLNQTIDVLKAQSEKTQAELTKIDNDISTNQTFIKEAVTRLEQAQVEYDTLQEEIATLEILIEKRNGQLEEQARKIQVDGQTANYIEFVLDSESISDVIGRIDVVSNLVQSNKRLVEAQVRDKEAVVTKQDKTEQTIVQQNALAEELEQVSADLEQQQLEQEVLVAQLASEKATAESDRTEFLVQKAAAEEQVVQLVTARDEAAKAAQEAEEQRQREEEEAAALAVAEAAAAQQAQEEAAAAASQEVSTSSSNESTENTEVASNESVSSPAPSAPAQNNTPAPSVSSNEPAVSNSSNNSSSNTSSSSSNNSSSNESSSNTNNQPAANPAPAKKEEPKKQEAPKKEKAPEPKASGTSWSSLKSIADTKLGAKYVWGSKGPNTFDCSGFTSWVFRQAGKSIPGNSGAQYASSQKVSNPQAGDLVFFGTGGRVTHVGIYAGGGQFVGAQTSSGVAYTSVNSSYWGPKLIGYGRY